MLPSARYSTRLFVNLELRIGWLAALGTINSTSGFISINLQIFGRILIFSPLAGISAASSPDLSGNRRSQFKWAVTALIRSWHFSRIESRIAKSELSQLKSGDVLFWVLYNSGVTTSTTAAIVNAPSLGSEVPAEQRRRWFEVSLVLLVAFGSSILYSLFLLKNAPSGEASISDARWAARFVQDVTALLLLGYVLSRRGLRFSNLGLRWALRDLAVGTLVAGVSYVAYVQGFMIIQAIHKSMFGVLAASPASKDFFGHPSLIVVVAFCLLNPFFEELIVRAYLMTEIIELTGSSALAVVLSLAVQFSYHLYYGWTGALSLCFQFLIFALYYARFRRALPIIMAHCIFDVYGMLRLLGK
jgi:membrane protease YdiL (CAAX protease family)